jgi:hypothetical protein
METWYAKICFALLRLELFVAAVDFLRDIVFLLSSIPLQYCPNSVPVTALISIVGKSFRHGRNQACRLIP